MHKHFKITFLLALLLNVQLRAQQGGKNTFAFLEIPVPARIASLGGSAIALHDKDINLIYNNPTLLNEQMAGQASVNFVNYLVGIKSGYLCYAHHLPKYGTFAGSIQYLDYGRIDARDEMDNIVGSYKAADYSFNISYAKQSKDSLFNFGATLKNIYSSYAGYTAYGLAIDGGVNYYNPKSLFSATLLFTNVGRQLKTYAGLKESLPSNLALGISKKLNKAPLRFSLTFNHLATWKLKYTNPVEEEKKKDLITGEIKQDSKSKVFFDNLGRHLVLNNEFNIGKNIHIDLGFNYNRRRELRYSEKTGFSGITWGFGFKVYKFHFAYARARYHIATVSNQFSITTDLNYFKRKSAPSPVNQ